MPTITAVEPLPFKKRVLIWIDGEAAFSLASELTLAERLAPGVELTPERIESLQAQDERQRAVAAALGMLSRSPRAEADLRQRLRRRGLRAAAVDAALGRMRELGYLDDAAFARGYVEARQSTTPRSRRALASELARKGVARTLLVQAVEPVSDPDAAYEAARRRMRSLHGLDFAAFQRRLGAFLSSRGFGYGVARATIERCWRELQEES